MNRIKDNLSYYILFFCVLLFGIVMAALYSVPIFSVGLVFSLYTLTGMLLPGYALVNLLKIKCKTDVELMAYITFFGYFASFVQYFFVVPLGIQDYATFVWIGFVIVSGLYLWVQKKGGRLVSFEQKDSFGFWAVLVLVLAVVFVKCGLYAGINLLPYDEVEKTGIHEDLLYWIGNTVELTKRFPPYEFRLYGVPYNYHYFTSVQLAVTSLAVHMGPALLSLGFSYIYPSLMMVFGGYIVFSKCTKNNWLRLGAMASFLFTSGFSDLTDNRYAGYMYEYPFAFDYGMAIFLFVAFLVIEEFYKEKLSLKDMGILATFFILLCGVKANFGALALVGMGMCCLRWFSKKEQRKKAIILGSIALVIFAFVYIFVTNLKGYSGSAAAEFMQSNLLTNGSGFGDGKLADLYERMLSHSIPAGLSAIMIAVIYTFLSQPLVFVIMTYQILRAIAQKRRLADGSVCLLVMVAVGVFLCVFVGMYGWSERYFMYGIFPCGVMFDLLNWEQERLVGLFDRLKIAAVAVLFIVSFYGLIKYDGRLSFVQDTARGYSRYFGSDYYKDFRSSVTKKELEAFEWLSENSGRYDLIATNHQSLDAEIGVFSQCNIIPVPNETYSPKFGVYLKKDGGELDQYFRNDLGMSVVFKNEEVEVYGKNY